MRRQTAISLAAMLAIFFLPLSAKSDSIFKNTPFSGAAKWVGDRTGTNNLQQKLGLPNAGGAISNAFEQAKKNSGPLVTTITTLACPGCLVLAGAISGPGAVLDAVFTTGVVTAAFAVDPTLGIASVVVLGADKDSGQVGYQEVPVLTSTAQQPTGTVHSVMASCIGVNVAEKRGIVLFANVPPNTDAYKRGDTINATAPNCDAITDNGVQRRTTLSMKLTGKSPIDMTEPRFQYLMLGQAE